jgi:HEPN domain-containing protein
MPLPSDALHIANLLRIAAQDLDGARRLAAANNRNAAYLCQQAAEKVLRAVAHPEGGHIGREHRLDVILDHLPQENGLKPLLKPLEPLTLYATTFRYPRESGSVPRPPSAAQMATFIARVETALDAAARVFGVDLTAPEDVPAADASPVRDASRAPLSQPPSTPGPGSRR